MDFREKTIANYAVVFNGGDNEDEQTVNESFAEKWGWFGVMYRLTNGTIVNLEKITNLTLYECLTWLTYETDLNEQQKVKYDSK